MALHHRAFGEKASGTSTNDGAELASILEFILASDELVVTRFDVSCGLLDLQDIVRALRARGGDAAGALAAYRHEHGSRQRLPGMLVFDEFETNLRRAPALGHREGVGRVQGPSTTVDADKVRELKHRAWAISDYEATNNKYAAELLINLRS